MAKYTGNGAVASTDFHAVKWVGKSKDGKAVTVSLAKALNMGNIEWTFAEKDDVVAAVTFTSCYTNTDALADSTAEAWEIEINGQAAGAGEIMLGAGVFYIDNVAIALTRGGGSFTVEREFRQINADGDRGPVEGRVVMDSSVATLTVNTLQILTKVDKLYAGVTATSQS